MSALDSINADAFLKLFVTQLRHQDPTKPLDASQMLSELAQLTSVQQMSEMNQTFQAAFETEKLALARGLIGAEITFKMKDTPETGVVEGAAISEGKVGVITGGTFVPLDAVKEIRAYSSQTAPDA